MTEVPADAAGNQGYLAEMEGLEMNLGHGEMQVGLMGQSKLCDSQA